MSRRTFLVGRVTRKWEEMVVVAPSASPSLPGPWKVRALVRPLRSTSTGPEKPEARLH